MTGPGRPPAPPLDIDSAKIEQLVAEAHRLSRDKAALKAWLAPKRIFHVMFQDYLATLPVPGGKGVALNQQSSELFLKMSEPLADALADVELPEDDIPESEERVVKPPQRKRGRKHRV